MYLSKIGLSPEEGYLLSGDLESSNQWYSIAKISSEANSGNKKQFDYDYVFLCQQTLWFE